MAGSRDARVTGVEGGAYPAKHQQGYTSATDADEKVNTTNIRTNLFAKVSLFDCKMLWTFLPQDHNGNIAASNLNKLPVNSPSSSESVFQHGAPISVRIRTPVLDCLFCGKEGRLRCSRCKSWYCSQRCQANHWPMHKLECIPPPPLENPDG